MKPLSYEHAGQQLHQLMAGVNCRSLSELSQLSGLSSWQLQRVRHGLIARLPTADLVKLADALQVPVTELLSRFQVPVRVSADRGEEGETFREEYRNLQRELARAREGLTAEFQRESIETLEPWLVQWPTAEAVARQNPDLSAIKILPLVKPIWNLLRRWGVEPIHEVGQQVPFDPLVHQPIDGVVEPGIPVLVRYAGYRHGDKLLCRARVSAIAAAPSDPPARERPAVPGESRIG